MAVASYIIKGGTIIDGSGFPMTKGDIAISGSTIRSIGLVRGNATRIIDASGKYVLPGVIDIVNHADTHWRLFTSPSQESLLQQGITTIIGGACGSSVAPISNVQAIRGIQKWIDLSKVNVNWKTLEEFFHELEKHPRGVNFGTLIGHGTLRRNITGDNPRHLTVEELDSMKLLLRRSLDEGALGLSLGLATSHGGGVPQEEIIALGEIVASTKKLLCIHIRNEGRQLLSSIVEAINLARITGVRVEIVHLKAIGKKAWGVLNNALSMIRKAREREHLQITVNFFPYLRTGSLLYMVLPEWIHEGGKDAIIARIIDKDRQKEILESIKSLTLHYDHMVIAEAQKDKHIVGKSITDIATSTGMTPEETILHILTINGLGVTIFGQTLLGKNLVAIAKESYSAFATDGLGEKISDGISSGDLTHPRSYGAAPRFIHRLVKESGIYSWEEAIKRMTYVPAERAGIHHERGLIKKGYSADIVIIDPDTIRDTATYKNPYQYPKGIEYVFVNGRLAIEKGTFTQALAGKILRG